MLSLKCLLELICEAIWSWTFRCREFFHQGFSQHLWLVCSGSLVSELCASIGSTDDMSLGS